VLITLDSRILEPLDHLFGLIDGLGQFDRFLHSILLTNLINRSTFVVRSLNIDHFVIGITIYVVRTDVDLGEGDLGLVERNS
jgi:hypothetical protein